MKAQNITVEWLQQIDFKIQSIRQSPTIEGVIVRDLQVNLDGRGEVTELWSEPWLVDGFLPVAHVYQSATDYGVVKCWHLHELHTDQLIVTRGKFQVTLVDLRQESSTFGHVNVFFLGTLRPRLLKIPPMILHGWKALSTPEVLVVNLQSHVYTPDDEYRFPWDCVLVDIWEPKNG
jgi:dTDP-4-dehydrorhamnose 3,5-epimerase